MKLIKSYLTNRKQVCKNRKPQGYVHGPLLFLIYINDLVDVSPAFNYILFANDTNLLCDNHSFTQSKLLKIQEWCCANKLIINFSKTQQIIFRNPQKRIQLDNYEIQDLKIVDHSRCCTRSTLPLQFSYRGDHSQNFIFINDVSFSNQVF